jgi:hypothetical protein
MSVIKANLYPKSGKKKAEPPVQLTSTTTGILFTTLDQNGNPMSPPPAPTDVTTQLTVDNVVPGVVVAPGVDSLHFTVTFPANSTGTFTLTGTETYNAPTPGSPFTNQLPCICPTPPLPQPTTLSITLQ